MRNTKIKTYSELMTIPDYLDRYYYLKIGGAVGKETFGHDRWLNQILYSSDEWKDFRREIIIRDNGCDMGHPDYKIIGSITVHHIDPITVQDVLNRDPKIFDPENVISVAARTTHNAIHYGDESLLVLPPIERRINDTCPWKRGD